MTFLVLVHLIMMFYLRVLYHELRGTAKETTMSLEPLVNLYIVVLSLPFNLLLNHYLVHLETQHTYYALFNKLKFQKVQ